MKKLAYNISSFILASVVCSVTHAATTDDKIYFNILQGKSTSLEASVGSPPFFLNSSTKIIPVLTAAKQWANLPSDQKINLNEVTPGLVIVHELNTRWSLAAVQQSSWRAADGTTFSGSKQIAYNGIYLAGYRPRGDDRFRVSAGLRVNLQNGRTEVGPAASLLYESLDRRFFAQLGFPYSYLLLRNSQGLEYGLSIQISDNSFHINTQSLPGATQKTQYLKFTSLYVGPTVSAPITPATYLNFKVGANVFRSTKLLDEKLNEIPGTATKSPVSWFVKVGISVRFGLKSEGS